MTTEEKILATDHGPSAGALVDAGADDAYRIREDYSVRYLNADCPVYREEYDLIFSLEHLDWIKDKKAFLETMYKVLAGGVVIIVMHDADKLGRSIAKWQQLFPELFINLPSSVEINNDILGIYPTPQEEMVQVLSEIGFTNVNVEKIEHTFGKTREEYCETLRPRIMSRPLVQYIQGSEKRQEIFLKMVQEISDAETFSKPFLLIRARK